MSGYDTHNNSHPPNLNGSTKPQQKSQDPPSILPLLFSTRQDDHVRHERHALDDDGKGHEEADAAPHGAEGAVFAVAVVVLREVGAGAGEGGAALVEAVGVVDVGAGVLKKDEF